MRRESSKSNRARCVDRFQRMPITMTTTGRLIFGGYARSIMAKSIEPSSLTSREREIVGLIELGLTRWAIADRLGLNESTVRQYVRDLCTRFDCPMRDLPEAVEES